MEDIIPHYTGKRHLPAGMVTEVNHREIMEIFLWLLPTFCGRITPDRSRAAGDGSRRKSCLEYPDCG